MWLDYDDKYAVSEEGLVMHKRTGKIFTTYKMANGYECLSTPLGGTNLVHRIVALCFLPRIIIPNAEVDHIDRDQTNNNASNLRWVNRRTNLRNTKDRISLSGMRHISYRAHRPHKPWRVRLYYYNKEVYCRSFVTLKEAITARDEQLKILDSM